MMHFVHQYFLASNSVIFNEALNWNAIELKQIGFSFSGRMLEKNILSRVDSRFVRIEVYRVRVPKKDKNLVDSWKIRNAIMQY